MPIPRIRLALRDWDHLVPLLTGRVRARGVALEIETREITPDVLAEPGLDGGETSFSRYALGRGDGDERLAGLPVFVMRGFRQRCVLVRNDSALAAPRDLAGATIGFDSGVYELNHTLYARPNYGRAGLPLTRADWYS